MDEQLRLLGRAIQDPDIRKTTGALSELIRSKLSLSEQTEVYSATVHAAHELGLARSRDYLLYDDNMGYLNLALEAGDLSLAKILLATAPTPKAHFDIVCRVAPAPIILAFLDQGIGFSDMGRLLKRIPYPVRVRLEWGFLSRGPRFWERLPVHMLRYRMDLVQGQARIKRALSPVLPLDLIGYVLVGISPAPFLRG